ncbi:hypothetical protein BV22DRAFT_884288 [Leucogyrophana mollusca]|uniref:Uncharacterized protein n=1 Tax=Leucogyrophana mollusca TaxID=85980 RepID=A0ACB8B2S9_9AGAM|nr:hypothetical protein BV22DRAFT_884288 [Leucogyrophana mollusca]
MSMSSNPIEPSGGRQVPCRPTRVFKGHTKLVTCVVCIPDGRHVASSSSDKTIIVWDVESGGRDGRPLQHDSNAMWVAISPNGRRIASGIKRRVVELLARQRKLLSSTSFARCKDGAQTGATNSKKNASSKK